MRTDAVSAETRLARFQTTLLIGNTAV